MTAAGSDLGVEIAEQPVPALESSPAPAPPPYVSRIERFVIDESQDSLLVAGEALEASIEASPEPMAEAATPVVLAAEALVEASLDVVDEVQAARTDPEPVQAVVEISAEVLELEVVILEAVGVEGSEEESDDAVPVPDASPVVEYVAALVTDATGLEPSNPEPFAPAPGPDPVPPGVPETIEDVFQLIPQGGPGDAGPQGSDDPGVGGGPSGGGSGPESCAPVPVEAAEDLLTGTEVVAVACGAAQAVADMIRETAPETSLPIELPKPVDREYLQPTDPEGSLEWTPLTDDQVGPQSERATPVIEQPPAIPLPALLAGSTLVSAAAVVSSLFIFPGWRRWLAKALAGFLPVALYSRLTEEEILAHPKRSLLYDYIRENAGERLEVVRRSVNLSNGTMMHHLRILAARDLVRVRREEGMSRLYPAGPAFQPTPYVPAKRRQILDILQSQPGLTQRELARTFTTSERVMSYHVHWLKDHGLLTIEHRGTRHLCFRTLPTA